MPIAAPDGFRGIFRTDEEARAVYAEAAGIARILPRAVAVPADADDVATLVRWAVMTRTPLVPRGSGSSMTGAAIGDGVIVDMSRFRAIGAVDADSRTVRAEPGVLRDEIEAAARPFALRFPPDPSSSPFCTIGGMVSTNAAGSHTLRFGPTRAWVHSLDIVFDDGSRATLTRGAQAPPNVPALDRFASIATELCAQARETALVHEGVRKDSSGYGLAAWAASGDLVDLIVGSEGTLGIIVGVEVSLAPLANATASVLGAFASLDDAVRAATGARDAGAAACELLDRTFLDVVQRNGPIPGIPAGVEAVLLAEVEGDDDAASAAAARSLGDTFTRAGATSVMVASTDADEDRLWKLRHAASPILSLLGPSLTSMQFIEDSALPPDHFAEYVRGVREILARHGVTGVIFGHAGDSHAHVNPLIDVNRDGWRDRVTAILDDVVTLVARLGGTLDGEHGDGRLRTPLLGRVWSVEAMDAFRVVKQAFDPAGVFNPGVKVPIAGEQAIVDIKYDPQLSPLPPRAARALERVTATKGWARFRLDLIDRDA